MSVHYRAVQWNRQKRIYDACIVGGIVAFLAVFVLAHRALHPEATTETVLIRGTATLALVMLHGILAIGPLARIDRRFLPFLYNRRHLGVAMFLVAAVHGVLSILQFHSLGDEFPLVSLFTSNTQYTSLADFPFQPLGFFALVILFFMAATSHDFWLANLSPRVWKTLHMFVYLAYALVVMHVMLGAAQRDSSPWLVGPLAAAMLGLVVLHVAAGRRETRFDAGSPSETPDDGFVDLCAIDDIPEDRAVTACLGDERIAVFRYDGKISAISNVCRHQNGPLGEGKVIDGCVTCPWHGFQYLPAEGRAPEPFTEKLETYDVRIDGDRVLVNPTPHPEGTARPPAVIRERDVPEERS